MANEQEIKNDMDLKQKDVDGVLGQVNLKRLKNYDDTMINQDRINKLSNIRKSVAMLEQQE